MKSKYTHDFSSASIKHQIEAEFYQIAGNYLAPKDATVTIVTGPDYKRHLDNVEKYIKSNKVRVCEINTNIFIGIYQGCKDQPKVSVVNKSVELFGSRFIDCDLTCTSDLEVIRNTLLKQIDVQSSFSCLNKAFIMTVGLRNTEKISYCSIFNNIIGLLGASIQSPKPYSQSQIIKCDFKKDGNPVYQNRIKFQILKGRIKEYVCYSYNAGGGPMLTCLIIYK